MAKTEIGYSRMGDRDPLTGKYFYTNATVFTVRKDDRYELTVRQHWGLDRGLCEEYGSVDRRYRADSLDELLAIAISEVRDDDEFKDNHLGDALEAIRRAMFEAEDTLLTGSED